MFIIYKFYKFVEALQKWSHGWIFKSATDIKCQLVIIMKRFCVFYFKTSNTYGIIISVNLSENQKKKNNLSILWMIFFFQSSSHSLISYLDLCILETVWNSRVSFLKTLYPNLESIQHHYLTNDLWGNKRIKSFFKVNATK